MGEIFVEAVTKERKEQLCCIPNVVVQTSDEAGAILLIVNPSDLDLTIKSKTKIAVGSPCLASTEVLPDEVLRTLEI